MIKVNDITCICVCTNFDSLKIKLQVGLRVQPPPRIPFNITPML